MENQLPFFARFLETQQEESDEIAATMKWPSDWRSEEY